MSDIEQQFAGNYVRLVNQCRDLQADIAVKDKMIANMVDTIAEAINFAKQHGFECYNFANSDLIEQFKSQAQKQLVAEQNKKATDNASV